MVMIDARKLLPADYGQIFPREILGAERLDQYRRASELHSHYLYESVAAFPQPTENELGYEGLFETNQDKILSPIERAITLGVVHRSDEGTAKLRGARQTMGTLPEQYINLETASHPPAVDESFYNRVLPNARWIAALKAYQDLSQIDTEFSPELQERWQAETAHLREKLDLQDEFQRRIYDGLRYLWYIQQQAGAEGKEVQWNMVGSHAFVVASDILVKRHIPGDAEHRVEKVYKPPHFETQQEAFDFLRATVGEASLLMENGYLRTEYEAGLATYEIFSDSGMTVERKISIRQKQVSDEFLVALVYGVDNPLTAGLISPAMRLFFHETYLKCQSGLGGRTPDDVRGYTHENGMPLSLLNRINGAWPDDCAFVTDFLIEEITVDGQTAHRQEEETFQAQVAHLRKVARGYPIDLNGLIRRHLQVLHLETVAGVTPRTEEEYYAVGLALTEDYQSRHNSTRQLLGGTWYEFNEDLTAMLGNEYWDVLVQALLAA